MDRSISSAGSENPASLDQTQNLWAQLDTLAKEPGGLKRWRSVSLGDLTIPSYVFVGPRGSGPIPLRLGLLGGIDANDSVGTRAIVKLLIGLDLASLLAEDLALFVYPLVQPGEAATGLLDFFGANWKADSGSMIHFLEQEIAQNRFDGIILVKADQPVEGFQIQVSNRLIANEVLWPGLECVARTIPLAADPIQVRPQLDEECRGFLGLADLHLPFTVLIRTPNGISAEDQIAAIVFSVERAFGAYRELVRRADSL